MANSKILSFRFFLPWVFLVTAIRLIYLVINHRPLLGEEPQYWYWSTVLSWGYHSKGPLIAGVIRASTELFGSSPAGIRLLLPIAYAVSSIMVYKIAEQLFDKKVAWWSGVTWLLLPAVTFSATVMSTDPWLLLFWSLALYSFIKAERESLFRWWLLCGIAVGLGFLAKYTMLIFLLSIFMYSITTRPKLLKQSGWLVMLVAILVTISPNLFWNAQHQWVTFRHVQNHNIHFQINGLHWGAVLEFLGSQFIITGPVIMVAMILCFLRPGQALRVSPAVKILFWQVAPLFIGIICMALMRHAYANWAAPIYIAGSIAAVIWLVSYKKTNWLVASLCINIFLACSFYTAELLLYYKRLPAGLRMIKKIDEINMWALLGNKVLSLKTHHPNVVWLFNNRLLTYQMAYHAKISSARLYMFNSPDIQADLLIKAHKGQDFFFLTKSFQPKNILDRFSSYELIEKVSLPVGKNSAKTYYIYKLNAFKGYEAIAK